MKTQRLMFQGASVALCALLASACAVPTRTSIAKFAESTAGVATIAGSAAQLDVEVQARTNAIVAAGRMASGRAANFPPAPGVLVGGRIDALWSERVKLMNGLKTYAVSLAEATDPALADGVVDAAVGLSVAIADFSTARANRIRDERKRAIAVAEALQQRAFVAALIEVGGYVIDLAIAARVKHVMNEAHPMIERARDHLKQDLAGIAISLRLKRGSLAIALKNKLDVHAADSRLTTVDKYDLYMAAVDELGRIDGRIEVIADFGDVLDAMVKAHAALRESASDARALSEFLVAVRAIAAKIEAYQEIEHKLKELRRVSN